MSARGTNHEMITMHIMYICRLLHRTSRVDSATKMKAVTQLDALIIKCSTKRASCTPSDKLLSLSILNLCSARLRGSGLYNLSLLESLWHRFRANKVAQNLALNALAGFA